MPLIENEKKFVISDDFEITFKPISDKGIEQLPPEQKWEVKNLLKNTKRVPEAAIPELIAKIKEFPDIPKIYNYLFNAYIMTDNLKEAEKIAAENYKKHPDYLYGRINYAYIKLKNKEFDKIPPIFNNKFNLKEIFPNRKTFHINELANLTEFLSMYYMETGKFDKAENVYLNLKAIAPIHPLTKYIKSQLNQFKKKK